jgi:hypothetical protein
MGGLLNRVVKGISGCQPEVHRVGNSAFRRVSGHGQGEFAGMGISPAAHVQAARTWPLSMGAFWNAALQKWHASVRETTIEEITA